MHQGRLIVISAPSGAGKTSIAGEILKRNPSLNFSVSATTRPKRHGEVDGKDYFFLSRDEFMRRVAAGEFIEWEEFFGNCYGTLKSEVDRQLLAGSNLLFDVDVKGGLSIKRRYPDALLVFIAPPTMEDLKARLLNRKTENSNAVAVRLERVPMELDLGKQYDKQVVNDDLARAIEEIQSIIQQHLYGTP